MTAARTIAIVDYGAGNLRSIYKAVERVCTDTGSAAWPVVSADPQVIEAADAVVLPGVGAAGPTMRRLEECGLVEPLRSAALSGRPFLGVCLGMQLLFEHHEEGDVAGLGVLAGQARRFRGGVKVPHMGWNLLLARQPRHPMFGGIAPQTYFYYVHSYYVEPGEADLVVGVTEYEREFCGALARGNLWATQFHPEKSGTDGLRLLRNFVGLLEVV